MSDKLVGSADYIRNGEQFMVGLQRREEQSANRSSVSITQGCGNSVAGRGGGGQRLFTSRSAKAMSSLYFGLGVIRSSSLESEVDMICTSTAVLAF